MTTQFSNKAKKLAVIGDPIIHSLSPFLHNAMADMLGIDLVYLPYKVAVSELYGWLQSVKLLNIEGFNATMPHKVELVKRMDELSGTASLYGAVNTVTNVNGVLKGYNTDADGFASAINDYGFNFSGASIMVLGAGGAAKAIVLKAASDGSSKINLLNRTVAKAEALSSFFPRQIIPYALTGENLCSCASNADIVINCLPVGDGGIADGTLPLDFLGCLKGSAAVFDILYNPPETKLLYEAKRKGLLAVNGLDMLIYQAIYAFRIFTGADFDERAMKGKLITRLNNK